MKEKGQQTIFLLGTYGMEVVECGGTLAKHVQAGGKAYATISLTRPETRPQVLKASAILGVETSFLNFTSGELQADVESKRKIVRVIRETRPDIIITQDPEHSFHDLDPDRREAMILYIEAISLAARDWCINECGGFAPHRVKSIYYMTPERPNCIVDVANVFQLKEKAMAELTSQQAFTAGVLKELFSEKVLRILISDFDEIKEDPVRLGRALHNRMDQAFHLYHGLLSHSSFALAEPFRKEGRFELDYLL